jgi:hypothetical protein
MLSRLKGDLVSLNLGKPELAVATLQSKYPLGGDYLVEVRRLCQRGVDDGWLGSSGQAASWTFSLCKPSKYFPYSIEAARLAGTGPSHAHPKGEVTLCWALDGKPTFCSLDPGWIVFAPGTKHAPVVGGGTMFLLHFFPNGEVDWKVQVRPEAARRGASATVSRSAPARVATASRTARAYKETGAAARG